ncbi:cation:proton antiporter [Paenisporosarcina quisquiliarum]|uniref:cation:proton antiporter n=1 Tax=Paenisporosarcina quisquiliarum TaxID=365346 RepID=UPI003736C8B0
MNLPLAIGLTLFALFVAAFIGIKLLRIPDIVIYILVGAGLSLTGYFGDTDAFKIAGEIGLIVLFFLLGMKFTFRELGRKGRKVWKASLLDIVLGIGVTFGISMIFGHDLFTSLLIAGLVYATSSSITVKLLEHKNKLDNKESGFILSLLIFEDLIAPILITILIGLSGDGFKGMDFVFIILKIALLVIGAVVIGKVVFNKAHKVITRFLNEDYFVLFILGVAISYGGFAYYLHLSEVIGAFLAGIMMAETNFKDKVMEVSMPVRNLFLPFFFLNFGLTLEFTDEVPAFGLLIVIVIWSILAKMIVGYYGGRWYGLDKRESFETGLVLTPRGEFSVIIAALASGVVQIFAGMYILIAALIGMFLVQMAPKIGEKIWGQRKDSKE